MLEGGVVRTIDFVPPAGYLELDAFVNAFKLGPLRPLAALPAGAEVGSPPEPGWRLLEPSDSYSVLFVQQVGDKQHVKWMRTYAPGRRPRVLPPMVIDSFDTQQARASQEAWSKRLGRPVEVTNSIGMRLALIPAGEFQMGSPDSDSDASDDEKPQHLVRITKPFYLGVTEVTQEQYERVMGVNPSRFKGTQLPVEDVSSEDAMEFCRKLSALSAERSAGRVYRLPTEAEWEYACRAGSKTKWSFGDTESSLGEYAWYKDNSDSKAHPVGTKKPNAWGLYDMHGNVFEWCSDWWQRDYTTTAVSDPTGPGPDSNRVKVFRGGFWGHAPKSNRSAARSGLTARARIPGLLGFRIAFTSMDASGR
jgi:formylglycine-generating enzyme required for sulfatase activity